MPQPRWILGLLLLAGATLCRAQPPQPGEGVLLPKSEYERLVKDAEAARKAKAAKPAAPSVCAVKCLLKPGERPTAVLTVTYQFQTTQRQSSVLLGGLKAFAIAAKSSDGTTPVLESTPDGLAAVIDAVGEQSITVTFETAIAPRAANDVGFSIGLPKAAITTFAFEKDPAVKGLTLATHLADAAGKPGDLKPIIIDLKKPTDAVPLGPTDTLDLSWDAPGAAAPPTEATLDIDATLRIDDRALETTATLRLRGPQRTWTLTLPPAMMLTATDATQLTPPADPKANVWTATLPAGATETTLTGVLKQSRDTKPGVPHAFGPLFAKGSVRTGGVLRVFAPLNVRFNPRPNADVRRVDAPASGDESPAALFRFANLTNLEVKPAPLLEYDLRAAVGFVLAQPQHTLKLTAAGWRLRSVYRVSPVRTAVEVVALEFPAGWRDPAFAPLDLVDEVQGGGDPATLRQLTVRLATPQREPFELTLEAQQPLEPGERQASLPLPRLPLWKERDTQVSVTVPEMYAATGSVRETATAGETPFVSTGSTLSGRFDNAVARVDVAWQPAAPRSVAEVIADVTVGERQAVVSQGMTFDFPEGVSRTVRLRGPAAPAGFRSTPALTATAPGEWTFTANSPKATLVLSYAVPVAFDAAWPVPLVTADSATANVTVRIGGNVAGWRAATAVGRWREAAQEPMPDRDTLPWLTLKSTEAAAALAVTWAAADPAGSVVIDRAAQQVILGETPQQRTRYLLKRWPATLEAMVDGGGPVTVFVDKQRVEPVLKSDSNGAKTIAIPLPESRPGRSSLLLEIRHTGTLAMPSLKGAVMRGGVWRQVSTDPGTLPLVFGTVSPELRWQWHGGLLTPQGAVTDANLDQWLAETAEIEPAAGTAALSLYTADATPLTVMTVPRLAAFAVGAVVALLVGFALRSLANRWRPVAVIAIVLFTMVCVLFRPALLAVVGYALQPGIAVTVVTLLGVAAVQALRRAKAAREATFSRGRPALAPSTSTPAIDLSAKSGRSASLPAPAN